MVSQLQMPAETPVFLVFCVRKGEHTVKNDLTARSPMQYKSRAE